MLKQQLIFPQFLMVNILERYSFDTVPNRVSEQLREETLQIWELNQLCSEHINLSRVVH